MEPLLFFLICQTDFFLNWIEVESQLLLFMLLEDNVEDNWRVCKENIICPFSFIYTEKW